MRPPLFKQVRKWLGVIYLPRACRICTAKSPPSISDTSTHQSQSRHYTLKFMTLQIKCLFLTFAGLVRGFWYWPILTYQFSWLQDPQIPSCHTHKAGNVCVWGGGVQNIIWGRMSLKGENWGTCLERMFLQQAHLWDKFNKNSNISLEFHTELKINNCNLRD